MRSDKGFTLVEVLVVIMILGVLMAMALPRLSGVREQARIGAMKMNMHNVQVVIELFHQDRGHYAEDFYEDGYGSYFPGGVYDEQIGKLPTNPWTGREMDPDEFNPEEYDKESDIANTDELGPNNHIGYNPGEMVYAVWEPLGASWPTHYGLVGIGTGGVTIRDFDADNNPVMFVLHN